MNVYEETSSTMRVRWEEADGATGYLLLYKSINASEPQLEMEVKFILPANAALHCFNLYISFN